MGNDRLFIAYVLTLTAGLASILTASVMAGIATLPSPLVLLEHLVLSFGIRATYKWVGGFSWDDWSLTAGRIAEVPAGAATLPLPLPEPELTREAA